MTSSHIFVLLSIYWLMIILFSLGIFFVTGPTLQTPRSICPKFSESVNKTSNDARLGPGSCTVEYKQLYMSKLRVQNWSERSACASTTK
jgi:hypothetical protein